ncbi:MAG: amidohydrolase family protein [Alphaproteobacteria bacterium]|nr:amidohydrolase family protein [Alphaproteobacteria bacterium]
MKFQLFACAMAACAAAVLVQAGDGKDDKKPKWDVSAPPLPTRPVTINVDEGTWMNVDVSPDGKTIAFDLLGDIYTMPITGGAATRIAEGLPFEMQPQFSPDGAKIAFTSDRGGADNIWLMNADGSDKRQLTQEKFRLTNEPAWSRDGKYVAARKHFTTQRSLGTGEIWLYHVGGGDGVLLVKRANEKLQKELGEPAFTPDGTGIYYARNVSAGNTFNYAQDSNTSLFEIERYDLADGEVSTVVNGAGGAVRPTPSPDGKKLAFVRRERNVSSLFVKTLATGRIDKIYVPLDRDLQETWAVHGVYPTMAWTPDSKSVVFWAGGKIRRVDLAGKASVIPFKVNDTRTVIDPPRPAVEVAPDIRPTQMPRYLTVSPDGKRFVFDTLGKLYVSAGAGPAKHLIDNNSYPFEYFPSFSRDGKSIVYVEWTDDGLGHVRIVSASGGGRRTVTPEPGHYRRPRFSPDGKTIVYEKGQGGNLLSSLHSDDPGIYRVPASGGTPKRVTRSGANPHFGAAGDRIFFTEVEDQKTHLVSVDLNGEAKRKHASGELVTGYEVSPKGDAVAFIDNYAAYVMPLTPGPQDVSAGKKSSAVPVVRVSEGGATYPAWSSDGRRLYWTLGPAVYSMNLDVAMPSAPKPKTPDPGKPAVDHHGVLGVSMGLDKPEGVTALVGARVVTMAAADGGVIEDGVVVVSGHRITAVGKRSDVTPPSGARIVDVRGKTIIPGLIDAHAHGPLGDDDIVPKQNWSAIAHLALGVTTIFDPSNQASEAFLAQEMQRMGMILGPRIFTTAEIVYGAKGFRFADIESYDDALAHVRRLKAQGAHGIKNYNQPRRDQRQQVVAAAIAENIAVVAEGASLFTQDVTILQDGNTSLEHNFPQAVLYEDVLSLFAQTKVAYNPTLVVTYGGLAGDPYWRYVDDVWTHPILSRHVPPQILQPRNVRRTKAPEGDFVDNASAREAKKLMNRGVLVSIGAHGQEEGLGSHWELWSFVRGGMSPLEALKTGTVNPARHLGFSADIGSLEAGKLADMLILSANPLENIRNSDKIESVMQNGHLYDAASMNEVVTGSRKRAPYYWE